jgi:hypothetical protein
MDEEQIISAPSLEEKNDNGGGNGVNKVLAGLVIILLLILVGGGAYFFGTKQGTSNENPTPTPEVFNQLQELPTAEPSPTSLPALTTTITPKPSIKPTITPTPTVKTKTLVSTASLDGFESSNGGGNTTVDIRAGRNVNLVTRGFVSFDLSSIPSNSTITEATLRLYQIRTSGNPYSVGGKLMVDSLNYGNSLENSDYALTAITTNLVVLTTNPSIEWKDAYVTEAVKKDLSEGRTKSQYRIHFETEVQGGDVAGDFAYFESADNSEGSGNTPQLVIKYY